MCLTFNLLNRFYSVLNEVFALERLQCIPIHPHPCLHRKRWQRFWELPTFTLRKESPWTSRVWSGWAILSIMLVVFMVRLDHFIDGFGRSYNISIRDSPEPPQFIFWKHNDKVTSWILLLALMFKLMLMSYALIWCTYIYKWNPGNLLRLSTRRGFANHREGWDDGFLPSDPGDLTESSDSQSGKFQMILISALEFPTPEPTSANRAWEGLLGRWSMSSEVANVMSYK